jgi:hypothetical protein
MKLDDDVAVPLNTSSRVLVYGLNGLLQNLSILLRRR